MRIACLFIPHFYVAVERARRPELRSQPIVIGGTPEERKVVIDCSQEAIQYGIQVGMSLREALSRCREATFLEADHALYHQTAAAINHALGFISPLVEPADFGKVFVGLAGLGKGPDAEPILARKMAQAVKQTAQLTAKIGIADGKFAAFAAAAASPSLSSSKIEGRTSSQQPYVIPPGKAPQFLAKLPVEYLPVPQDMHQRLRLFGLRTLGQLASLPLGAVQAQFGPDGRIAWELANGIDNIPLIPQRYPITLMERLSFPSPISSADALFVAAKYLITRITRRPEFAHRTARGLIFKMMLTNARTWERRLIFREPLASENRILSALRAKLEDISLPAAVDGIEVELLDICGEVGLQGNLFPSQRGHQLNRIDEVVRQLKSRYGQTLIAKVVEVEPWSRIPERRLALINYDP